jgi:hypothetical protein
MLRNIRSVNSFSEEPKNTSRTAGVFRRSCAVVGQVHSWKLRGVVISHSFAFSASRRFYTLVSMLELSPPQPVLLLLRVGGLSRLNTRAVMSWYRGGWPFQSMFFSEGKKVSLWHNHAFVVLHETWYVMWSEAVKLEYLDVTVLRWGVGEVRVVAGWAPTFW